MGRREATATAKSLQSCPTLCDPIPGILQARTLEWVAISFSNAWKWKVKVKSLSYVWLLVTPWTVTLPASSIHGILQARVLEWIAVAYSESQRKAIPKDVQIATPLHPSHLLKILQTRL